MKTLVTGAAGQLGREVVDALLGGGLEVRALSRGSDPGLPPGVDLFVGDLAEPATLAEAAAGTDGVFLLAGYTDESTALRQLAGTGVTRVVLLSSGCVDGGSLENHMVRTNLAAEIAVREAELAWTVLRPSGFMTNTLQWTGQLRAGDEVREPFPDVAVAMIDPADIAAAVVVVLDDSHVGRTYRLTGPEPLRPADRVHLLADVLDRPLQYVPEGDDDARRRMSLEMPGPVVDAFFRFYRDGEYDDSHVTPTTANLLGRDPNTFVTWATRHRHDFE